MIRAIGGTRPSTCTRDPGAKTTKARKTFADPRSDDQHSVGIIDKRFKGYRRWRRTASREDAVALDGRLQDDVHQNRCPIGDVDYLTHGGVLAARRGHDIEPAVRHPVERRDPISVRLKIA
jgi:hypothetical protein